MLFSQEIRALQYYYSVRDIHRLVKVIKVSIQEKWYNEVLMYKSWCMEIPARNELRRGDFISFLAHLTLQCATRNSQRNATSPSGLL
jgi:hypothetical protein